MRPKFWGTGSAEITVRRNAKITERTRKRSMPSEFPRNELPVKRLKDPGTRVPVAGTRCILLERERA